MDERDMENYEVVVHFNDDTVWEDTIRERSPWHALRKALEDPGVTRLAFAITMVEVA